MSNLVVSNISDGTTTVGTGYVVNGSAKAWVNFTTVSSTAVNNSMSFNISSLTDAGTGDTDVALSNAFSNASHVDSFNVGDGSNGDQSFLQTPTSASVIYCFNYNGNNAAYDSSLCLLSAHGDLA